MNDEATPVGGDLYDLWKVGAVHLPNMAVHCAQTTRDAHNAGWRADDAFNRAVLTGDLNGDGVTTDQEFGEALMTGQLQTETQPGPVFEAWNQLRQGFQKLMYVNAERLNAVGAAVVGVADHYAGRDGELRDDLNGRIEDLEENDDYDVPGPPEDVPDSKAPGDSYEIDVEPDPDDPGETREVPRR